LNRPTVDLVVAINHVVRRDDEWFDEPDELDRVPRALAAIDLIEDPVKSAGMDEAAARHALELERQTTLARIQSMRRDFEAIVSAAVDSNADDEHDPEGSTIAYDRAQTAALLSEAQEYLVDIDEAFVRLANDRYFHCAVCGAQITPERLSARPAARRCVQCASSTRTDPT
jgi:DnaK suppressor protein